MAFVLKYRLDPTSPDQAAFRAEITKRVVAKVASKDDSMGATPAAAEDAAAAVQLVRSRAKTRRAVAIPMTGRILSARFQAQPGRESP